jgi:hypothetical protein
VKIVATQDHESWFVDYVREALAEAPAELPPKEQTFGHVTARWHVCEPGIAHIAVEGGTVDDRLLVETVVRSQLEGHGFKQAAYTLSWDLGDKKLVKEATWDDIMAKAKRLIQSGDVQILRNGYNIIVGQVQGDHGTYQTEISRDDPNSQAITLWQCECPWDQFAWQRTRQWKKYEGRVCSHVLATYWQAQTMPLDEDSEPGQSPEAPQGPPGTVAPGASVPPEGSEAFNPNMKADQAAPGSMAPTPPPGQAPEPPDLLPPYQMNPATQPATNPVSVPGQKPQTPLNPVQYPGGTFSSIHTSEQEFVNGMMVSNKQEDVGTLVGRSPEHGAGNQASIPQNSVGEVLGVDPTTGMVNVYFAGPQAEAGKMEPHGIVGWFFPQELAVRGDVRAPGPAIQRRRAL